MKYTTLVSAVALLITGAMALPNPEAKPEPEANPQICFCANPNSCYDTCSQRACC